MRDKNKFFEGFADEEKPLKVCCQCERKACVRSYGGKSGDYCFDCYYKMLKQINEIK